MFILSPTKLLKRNYGIIYKPSAPSENMITTNGKTIFDIPADSSSRTTPQEKLWGVKMTPIDDKFNEQQCINLQPGYCSTFVDRKWCITSLRKKYENDVLEKSRESFQVLLFICH